MWLWSVRTLSLTEDFTDAALASEDTDERDDHDDINDRDLVIQVIEIKLNKEVQRRDGMWFFFGVDVYFNSPQSRE